MKEENGNAEKNTEEKTAGKKKNNENALVTKESIGAVGALFSALAFLILVTRSLIFGDVGMAVNSFLLGFLGYGAYFFVPLIFLLSAAAFIGKNFFKNKPAAVFAIISLYLILLLVHGSVTASWPRENYFSACFTAAEGGVKTCSPAGWLGGLIVGALFASAGKTGTFVMLSLALVCFFALTAKAVSGRSLIGAAISKIKSNKSDKHAAQNAQNLQNQQAQSQNGQNYGNAPAMPYGAPYEAAAGNAAPNFRAASPEAYDRGQAYPQSFAPNGPEYGGYSRINGYETPDTTGGADYRGANYPVYEKRNEYGFPTDNFRQRPGVTLSKNISDRSQEFGGAYREASYGGTAGQNSMGQNAMGQTGNVPKAPDSFSPFGNSYYGNNTPNTENFENGNASAQPQNGKDLIYGADPVESFRNNLIFDPDSKFNRRKSAANEPIASATNFTDFGGTSASSRPGGARQSASSANVGFGRSYTDSYADSVNGYSAPSRMVSGNGEVRNADFRGGAASADKPNTGFAGTPYARESSDFSARDTGNNASPNGLQPDRAVQTPIDAIADEDSVSHNDFSNNFDKNGREDSSYGNLSLGSRDRLADDLSRGRADDDFTTIFDDEPEDAERSMRENSDRNTSSFSSFSSRGESLRDIGEDPDESPRGGSFRNPESGEMNAGRNADASDIRNGDFGDDSRNFGISDRGSDNFERDNLRGGDISGKNSFATPESRGEREISRPAPVPVPPPAPKPRVIRPYRCAPLDYFDCTETRPDQNAAEIDENKATILDTLEAFKVPDASIASVTCGPTVTRYNVAVPRNISPKKVVALDQPIAMNLHAKNGVNIAPNFEDGTISVEVPNKKRQTVTLGSMLVADEYINSKPNALIFAMGKTVDNVKTYGDIRKMTHVLVAGTSGSGKTAFLHSIIISLIMKYSPADLRLILIDPKKTEFVVYEGLPHLVINEVLSDTNKVIQSLNWAIGEMERRYDLFNKKSRAGTYVINIDEYNANLAEGEEKLPKIVIIADEVAAMMQDAKKDMEDRIQNLTQKSRATGIHVILATQRPSTDVITGVIKSNLKSRIALSVAQEIDSRVILDESGAQNLLGQGDLLYSTEGTKTPIRMQAPFISSEKAQEVIRYIKENNDCNFNEEAAAYIDKPKGQSGGFGGEAQEDDEVDYVYVEALRNVILSGSASISLVQRKCSVGYNKAGKIIEWMEDQGYISAFDGAKARKVLITPEQFEEKYGPL